MHSPKQTVRNKSARFGYKSFVLANSDGYPYHIIPYSGAKGVGGRPGKDLTVRVVSTKLMFFFDSNEHSYYMHWKRRPHWGSADKIQI